MEQEERGEREGREERGRGERREGGERERESISPTLWVVYSLPVCGVIYYSPQQEERGEREGREERGRGEGRGSPSLPLCGLFTASLSVG